MAVAAVAEYGQAHGHMVVRTYDWEPLCATLSPHNIWSLLMDKEPAVTAETDNIFCTVGLNTWVVAMNWSSIEDQNANMGSPFSVSYLAPIFGAIGSSNTAPTSHDTALTTELARTTVVSSGTTAGSPTTNPQIVWSFLFGTPGASRTIAEAGVFLQATSALGAGALFDHALISPAVTQSTSQLLTLTVNITLGN